MEFTRLSDVLVGTATDTTNVLVEIDGEIKRVPKDEVGGSKGYVMVLNADNYNTDTYVCTVNYDDMYDVLMEGGTVWVDFSFMFEESEAVPTTLAAMAGPSPSVYGTAMSVPLMWLLTDVGLVMMCFVMGGQATIIFTNGSHNLETPAQES